MAWRVLLVVTSPVRLLRLTGALERAGYHVAASSSLEAKLDRDPSSAFDFALLPPACEGVARLRAHGDPTVIPSRSEQADSPREVLACLAAAASRRAPPGRGSSAEPGPASGVDALPFAELLMEVTSEQRAVSAASPLADRVRTALEAEGLHLGQRHLGACVRACEAAIESTLTESLVGTSAAGSPLMAGRVGEVPVEAVLQLPASGGLRARCRFERPSEVVELSFDGEHILGVRAEGGPAERRLGAMLLASEAIGSEALERALGQRGGRLGRRLRDMGALAEPTLREVLRRQAEERVLAVMSWAEGRFALFATPADEPSSAGHPPLVLPALLLEGARRFDEARRAG